MGKLDGKIDAVFADMAMPRHPGAALLVIDHDEIVCCKCYGLADLETQRPITADSSFYLASISKQFTAMAVMMLAERGKLNVQDPICKYLTDCPTAWQPVSIHHLLTMSSGIPNFTDFPDWLMTRASPATYASTIARFKDKPLDFPPGSKYNYSNSGYVLLAYIVEKVAATEL